MPAFIVRIDPKQMSLGFVVSLDLTDQENDQLQRSL